MGVERPFLATSQANWISASLIPGIEGAEGLRWRLTSHPKYAHRLDLMIFRTPCSHFNRLLSDIRKAAGKPMYLSPLCVYGSQKNSATADHSSLFVHGQNEKKKMVCKVYA
jgi:hypothetical protein